MKKLKPENYRILLRRIDDKDKINIWDKYSDVHSELRKKLGTR
jgi:hypothetical protein